MLQHSWWEPNTTAEAWRITRGDVRTMIMWTRELWSRYRVVVSSWKTAVWVIEDGNEHKGVKWSPSVIMAFHLRKNTAVCLLQITWLTGRFNKSIEGGVRLDYTEEKNICFEVNLVMRFSSITRSIAWKILNKHLHSVGKFTGAVDNLDRHYCWKCMHLVWHLPILKIFHENEYILCLLPKVTLD